MVLKNITFLLFLVSSTACVTAADKVGVHDLFEGDGKSKRPGHAQYWDEKVYTVADLFDVEDTHTPLPPATHFSTRKEHEKVFTTTDLFSMNDDPLWCHIQETVQEARDHGAKLENIIMYADTDTHGFTPEMGKRFLEEIAADAAHPLQRKAWFWLKHDLSARASKLFKDFSKQEKWSYLQAIAKNVNHPSHKDAQDQLSILGIHYINK